MLSEALLPRSSGDPSAPPPPPQPPPLLRSGQYRNGGDGLMALVSRLPPSGAAISLNLVGLAGMASLESTSWPHSWPTVIFICMLIRPCLLIVAVCIQLVMVMRLSVKDNWREMESLHLSSADGALLIAIQLTLSSAPSYFGEMAIVPAEVGVLIAATLQCGIWTHFVHHIWIYRARIEPFWTPVILFPAVFPLTWPSLPFDSWVYFGGLFFGIILGSVMWPICVWRMLTRPDRSADPSIFMVMAPVAFVTIGCFTTDVVALLPRAPLTVLWAINVVSVSVTACAAAQRWRPLLASLRPMQPGWVAVTFPLASNANTALRFWSLATRTSGVAPTCPGHRTQSGAMPQLPAQVKFVVLQVHCTALPPWPLGAC